MIKIPTYYIKKLSATNMVKLIIGNTSTAADKTLMNRAFAVTHIQFDSANVLDENLGDYIDEAQLRDIITVYWTQSYDGQVPTTTTVDTLVSAFKIYCKVATRVLGRFCNIKRVQDCFNIDNDDLGQLGQLFTKPDDMNIGELGPIYGAYSRYYDIFESQHDARLSNINTVYGNLMTQGITSAQWSRAYIAPLKDVYLPLDVINLINLIHSVTFELSSDDDETLRYAVFWQTGTDNGNFPDYNSTEGSIANFYTAYKADIDSLKVILSAYPVLRAVINDMGFRPVVDYVNTRRDLSGKTLHIIRDNYDSIEYAIRSVLLSQQDNQSLTDMLANSRIMECKERYLPELVKRADFNAILSDLYNLQNFLRCKITILCVNIVHAESYMSGGAAHHLIELTCHSGDNITTASANGATDACAMGTTIDAVGETDALQSVILHSVSTNTPTLLSVTASLIEGSSRTFLIANDVVGNLLECVNSAFYVNAPAVIEKLHNTTLYSVEAGVTNTVTYGEDLFFNNKRNSSKSKHNTKKNKTKKENKDKEQNNGTNDSNNGNSGDNTVK